MSIEPTVLSIREKTVIINTSAKIYGTFAEIGAGQETSRWFFRTRGASSTVAKAISAYDMTFSDAIYGRENSGRYVCESRLSKMLDYEYGLVRERLATTRGSTTCFFSFANTVAARSQRTGDTGQGWVGIRFQSEVNGPAHEIRIHVRLFDKRNTLQQEALGNVGVNLIYASYHYLNEPERFVESLLEDIEDGRVEIDFIYASEHTFTIPCKLLNFYLLKFGLSQSLTYSSDGESIQPSDLLYKKNVLLFRDLYQPTTNYHLDLFECAQMQMATDTQSDPAEILRLAEVPFDSFTGADIDRDFLERLTLAQSCGLAVAMTRFKKYYEFAPFFEQNHVKTAAILIKTEELRKFLDEESYKHLKGGMLEGLGKYFSHSYKIYVSPTLHGQHIEDLNNFAVPSGLEHFYKHLVSNNWVKGTKCLNQDHLKINSSEIIKQIRSGQSEWVELVPQTVAHLITSQKMFKA